MFEYLEIFHNRQRRHSALGMLTPTEYETRPPVHRMTDSRKPSQGNRGKIKVMARAFSAEGAGERGLVAVPFA